MGVHDDRTRGEPSIEMALPEGRAESIRARIEAGARGRAAEPPPLRLDRTRVLEPQLHDLADALDVLRERMERYGSVEAARGGWVGRLELAAKRLLRKLVQRHLDQQKEVHEAIARVLDRLRDVLVAEHEMLDRNAESLSDEAVRRARRRDEP